MKECEVCFHRCRLAEGQKGFCGSRANIEGQIKPVSYGMISSLALDPIEKKPLKKFFPGSFILSVGSYGCNLKCPFCQNFEISQTDLEGYLRYVGPEKLVEKALALKSKGNIGIAFTYNEPLCSYEYVRDVSKLAKEKGLKTVLVTNGTCTPEVLKAVLPYIDAMNVDLKGFSKDFYSWVKGDLEEPKDFISMAATKCHVELTTLVIPSKNDSLSMMEEEAKWIASIDKGIPLHLSRYFPMWKCDLPPTPLETLLSLKEMAEKYLDFVYIGNV